MIDIVQFLKCLADETRLSVTLLIFNQGQLCVCELMAAMDCSQPKLSRHLAQLRNCGILTDERRGKWVYYSLNPALPAWVEGILAQAILAHQDVLTEHVGNLTSMDNRPNCC